MKPFILKYSRKCEPKVNKIALFYNKTKEIIENINLQSIEYFDVNHIIYATGTLLTEEKVDSTRDEAMDR